MRNVLALLSAAALLVLATGAHAQDHWNVHVRLLDEDGKPVENASLAVSAPDHDHVIGNPSSPSGDICAPYNRSGSGVRIDVYVLKDGLIAEQSNVPLVTDCDDSGSATVIRVVGSSAPAPPPVARAAEEEELPPPPPPPSVHEWSAPAEQAYLEQPAADGSGPSTRTIAAAASSGIAIGVAIVAWRLREGYADDFNRDPTCGIKLPGKGGKHCASLDDNVSIWQAVSIGGLVTAGIAGALSVLFYFDDARANSYALGCAPRLGSAGIDCSGHF